MVGNPVLGFLEAQPVGDDARSTVTKMLRFLGIAILVAFVINVVNAILTIAVTNYLTSNASGTGLAIGMLVIGTIITGLACWWITLAIRAWSTGQASGGTHVLVIGILAAVFGLLGILSGLGSGLTGNGVSTMYTVVSGLMLVMSAIECLLGILIIVNRGKALNPGTAGTPTRN